MEAIRILKKRLMKKNILTVQNEKGNLSNASFEWNEPVVDVEVEKLQLLYNFKLPNSYVDFLKISNGAVLFKDIKYSQWGCKILGVNEVMERTNLARVIDSSFDVNWIVFATWLGDGDILAFDLKKYQANSREYIIDGDEGYRANTWEYIKGGFEDWIDRLIVAQGAKYWRWY